MSDLIQFTVFGPPATKGSTVSFLSSEGKVITRTDSNGLRSWSESIGWAAREAKVPLLAKPKAVLVSVRFEFICPPSVKDRVHPTVAPDIDKLLRAVLDSLTKIAYDDDAQVIEVRALKVYGTRELTVFGIAPVTLI
jgi:Holliday junction resolvase RusA-like endonuclease